MAERWSDEELTVTMKVLKSLVDHNDQRWRFGFDAGQGESIDTILTDMAQSKMLSEKHKAAIRIGQRNQLLRGIALGIEIALNGPIAELELPREVHEALGWHRAEQMKDIYLKLVQ